jgi:transposase
MARFDAQIQAICGPFEEAVGLLDTIPGVARRTVEMLVAEIGTDMTRFPNADHLASWAGVAPGHPESAGKRTSGTTRKGHRFLRTTLVHAAVRPQHTYLSAQYRRLASRRGKKRAILAVAHSILVMALTCSNAANSTVKPEPTFLTAYSRKIRLDASSNA